MSPRHILKPSDNLYIRGYTLYNHIHQAGDKASGGSSIILNNSIPQSQIQLNTNLQAVAFKETLYKTIHVCSLYLPLVIESILVTWNNLFSSPQGHSSLFGILIATVMFGDVVTQTRKAEKYKMLLIESIYSYIIIKHILIYTQGRELTRQ